MANVYSIEVAADSEVVVRVVHLAESFEAFLATKAVADFAVAAVAYAIVCSEV